jgi:SNF2 family DNA or RNA helicase
MPTMFDSHEEFTEWFSKDIESHAEKQSGIDESKFDTSSIHKNNSTNNILNFFYIVIS